MTNADKHDLNGGFYLEDLHVGQRFASGVHAVDEAFAGERVERAVDGDGVGVLRQLLDNLRHRHRPAGVGEDFENARPHRRPPQPRCAQHVDGGRGLGGVVLHSRILASRRRRGEI